MEHWDHLEKLLGELYRKEIDNEENIWRSLPFFSATLAVEVAVVTQVSPLIVTLSGYFAWFAAGAAVLAMLLVAAVLFLLNRSVRPADFRYIASEPDLVEYISAFEAYAKRSGQPATGDALKTELQRLLMKQYARATPNNRKINQRRARARTNAGRSLLASIVVTLVLVAATVGPQLAGQVLARSGHGQDTATRSDGRPAGGSPAIPSRPAAGVGATDIPAAPAADATGEKGLVDGPRGAAPDGAGRPEGR